MGMVTHLVKHITHSEGASPNRVLVSRAMGKVGGKVKPSFAYAELNFDYRVDLANGETQISWHTTFPSGKYDALDFIPSWDAHRFVGWFGYSAEPSASIPDMSGELNSNSKVKFAIQTVYAHWQLPTTVTFDATTNGGVMPDWWVAPHYYAGQPFGSLPKPMHDELNFTGWYANGERVTESSIVPEGGVSLVAEFMAQSYTVNLNDQWQNSDWENPNPALYDGVYQSFSNTGYEDTENYSESMAKMYIDVVGYTHFRIYIASNSEMNYDYVVAMKPDVDPETPPFASWGEIPEDVMASTADYAIDSEDPSDINVYIPVDYELDGGVHRICIVYRKDSSYSVGHDCGYVLIPKEQ